MKKALTIAAAAVLLAAPAHAGVKTTEDVMTGVSRHVLQIESDTTVSNSIGAQKTATIVLRCEGGSTDAYVWTPTYNGLSYRSKPRVQTRWDGGKITTGSWGASKSGDAMFHPNPKSFIGELLAAKQFVFGWEPYSTQPVAARWDLQKHKADLTKMSRLCSGIAFEQSIPTWFKGFRRASHASTLQPSPALSNAYSKLAQHINL